MPSRRQRKNFNLNDFLQKREIEKKSLVLATGVFDVLHQEHLAFLQAAKKEADLFLLGIESDKRVRIIKGKDRPIHSEEKRLETILSLGIVDAAFILPEQFEKSADHQALIRKISPEVLAVSLSTPHLKEKKEIIKKYGGELKVVRPHQEGFSSTAIIQSWGKSKKDEVKE